MLGPIGRKHYAPGRLKANPLGAWQAVLSGSTWVRAHEPGGGELPVLSSCAQKSMKGPLRAIELPVPEDPEVHVEQLEEREGEAEARGGPQVGEGTRSMEFSDG